MPQLVKFYIRHVVIGFAVAALFVAGLLWFNVANLRHLILTSDIGLMAVLALWVLNGIVFAGVQFAIAVMHMAKDDDDDDGPAGGLGALATVQATNPTKLRRQF